MRRGERGGAVLAAVLTLSALAAANGLNLNSLGARALSMGGAFTAVADDFSLVFWNPAGAARLTRTLAGLHVFDLIPKTTYKYGTGPNYFIDARSEPAHIFGGLAAYYKPISPRIVIGFGISTPSGIGGQWKPEDFAPYSGGILYKWATQMGVVALSPLVAVKISEVVSAGATINFNYGTSGMSTVGGYLVLPDGPGFPVDLGQYEEAMSGWSLGATFGVLVTPSSAVSLGLTLKTPHTISFKGTTTTSHLPLYGHPGVSEAERKFTWPLSLAVGVAVRPLSRLLLSADVQWSQWSSLDRNVTVYEDPYQARLWKQEGFDDIPLEWEDKTQVRLGAEYALGSSLFLRAGYGYDPAPSPDKTINVLLPSYTYNTLTFGVGYQASNLRLDAGLEFMGGKDRIIAYSGYNYPGVYTMKMVIPSVSISYLF